MGFDLGVIQIPSFFDGESEGICGEFFEKGVDNLVNEAALLMVGDNRVQFLERLYFL